MPESFADWAAGQADPRFTEWLRSQSEPTWSAAVQHRFTQDLADGTLDDTVMRAYLVQDYVFLDSFVRLVASAVVKAPSLADRVPLCQFLGIVTSEENTYFQRAFDALGVATEERTAPVLRPVTRQFADIMMSAIAAPGYAATLTPLVVFEWLYLTWASAVADRKPQAFYLAEWIDIHANPQFATFVAWLRAQLDRQGLLLSTDEQRHLADVFRHTVEVEKAFFDDAYLPR